MHERISRTLLNSVASLSALGTGEYLANGCNLREFESCGSAETARVVLALDEVKGIVLYAVPEQEAVGVYGQILGQEPRKLTQVDSYAFGWKGGLLGSKFFFLVETSRISTHDLNNGALIQTWEVSAELATSSGENLVVSARDRVVVSRMTGLDSRGLEVVMDIAGNEISALALESSLLGMAGRDGEVSLVGLNDRAVISGRAHGVSGSCLTARFLECGFLRSIWSDGWLVDYDHKAHESLRIKIGPERLFRGSVGIKSSTIGVWDGMHVDVYRIDHGC